MSKKIVNVLIGDNHPPAKYDTELEVKMGDLVIVESPNGAEWGVVADSPQENRGKGSQNYVIIRVANEADENTINKLRADAKVALKVSAERVEKYKLDMKLLSAHYTLDGGKVIIQFSSAGRVDFRELVRDLAYSLRARIELRQVGPRDEVKACGSLGPCGQVCCCVRFKENFENITIKMAKTQNLSLNPQKINGMCGRLLCCLAYENKYYEDMAPNVPRWGAEVHTPDGKAIAQETNYISEKVNVKFQKGDSTTYGCYKLCDINCKGGCKSGGKDFKKRSRDSKKS